MGGLTKIYNLTLSFRRLVNEFFSSARNDEPKVRPLPPQ